MPTLVESPRPGFSKAAAVVLVVAVLLLVPTKAIGDGQRIADSNDTPGRLDVRFARAGHDPEDVLTHKVRTGGRWRTSLLARIDTEFRFYFSWKGYPQRTLYVDVSRTGKLYGEMRNDNTGNIRGYADVSRPSRKSLRISFPVRLLKPGLTQYEWSLGSIYFERRHPECGVDEETTSVQPCYDALPDRGSVHHELDQAP